MGVDLIPILIDEKTLAEEIMRLGKALPPEKLDNWETQFHHELFYEHGSNRNQYAYAKLEGYKNTKWCIAANSIRFQLLIKAKETVSDGGDSERSADALFQFFGAMFCCFIGNNPLNEYGFKNSTIVSPANARRLHLLFQQINFDLLQPVFERHCKSDEGMMSGYIQSFGELVDYAKALDGLLVQASGNDKVLYIYAG